MDGFNLLWFGVAYKGKVYTYCVVHDRHCFYRISGGNVIYALDGAPALKCLPKSYSEDFLLTNFRF